MLKLIDMLLKSSKPDTPNITYCVLKFSLSVTRWSGTPFIRSSKILILAYHNNTKHF